MRTTDGDGRGDQKVAASYGYLGHLSRYSKPRDRAAIRIEKV